MSPRNTTAERGNRTRTPETRAEVLSVSEKLKREVLPAIGKLEELRQTASGAELARINRVIISMQDAVAKTQAAERAGGTTGTFKVDVEKVDGSHSHFQEEGIPLNEALEVLEQAQNSLPANSPQKPGYQKIIDGLKRNSVDYYQRQFSKSNADVTSGRTPLTAAEGIRQNLRNRTEAKLIAGDPERRSTKPNEDERLREDYDHAQEDLNKRIEWKYNPIELPKTLAVVEASHSAEVLAKMRAEEEMTKRMNQGFFLKKWWNRAMEEGIKQKLYEEELRKISGESKKPGWFARTILRKKAEANDGQNLHRDKDASGEKSKEEMSNLANRFAKDYVRQSEGEQRREITDPRFNTRISELVHNYATTHMSDAEFESQKDVLVADIRRRYPDNFNKNILTADNFLETARVFRKSVEHGVRLAQTDIDLKLVLGQAKSRIKSEENLSWTESIIQKVNKNALGKYVSPATLGYTLSAAGYFFKKPIQFLGGAFGAGTFWGMFRRSKQVKQDIAMHRREREAGVEDMPDAATAKRRGKVEQFVNNMEKASDILARIDAAKQAFEQNSTPENRGVLLKEMANLEARMSLAAQRQRGLIQYDGEMGIETTGMLMMQSLAEAKIAAGVNDITQTAEFRNATHELTKDVSKKDKEADKFRRWEMFKAGLVGGVTGGLAGVLAQEMTDEVGEALIKKFGHSKVWDWMDRPSGSTPLEHLRSYVASKRGILPGKHEWWDWMQPDYKGCAGGTHFGNDHLDTTTLSGKNIRLDDTIKLERDVTTGILHAKDVKSGQVLQDFMDVGGKLTPVGKLNPELEFLPGTHYKGGGNFWSTLKAHLPTGSETKKLDINVLYDNDTPSNPDLNELRFYMHNTGGKFTADLGKIVNLDSYHGKEQLDLFTSYDDIRLVFTDSHFSDPIVLKPDASGHLEIPNELKPFIEFRPNGTVQYKGDGWMGMVEELGQHNGAERINVINSIRGDGEVKIPSSTEDYWDDFGILRRFNDAQCGPNEIDPPMFVPFYMRHPLEERTRPQGTQETVQGHEQTAEAVTHTPEQIAAMSPEQRQQAAEAEVGSRVMRNQQVTPETFNEIAERCHLTPEQRKAVLGKQLENAGVNDWQQKLEQAKTAHERDHHGQLFNEEAFLLGVLNEAISRRAQEQAQHQQHEQGNDHPHEEDDGDDHEAERVTQTAETAERRQAAERAKAAIKEFNRHGQNKFPHIRVEFDPDIIKKQGGEIVERLTELQEGLNNAMEELRNDRRHRDRNFIFRFKYGESTKPEVTDNETEVLNFTLGQEVGEILPIFRRYLEGGFAKTKAAAEGKQTPARAAETGNRQEQETDAQKLEKILTKLKAENDNKINFKKDGNLISEADQLKVIKVFETVWGQLTQDKKTALLNRTNAHQTGDLNKGIVFNLVAGVNEIKFDSNTDCLIIPPNKNAEAIKAFLENPPAAPAQAARAAGGGRGGGGAGH